MLRDPEYLPPSALDEEIFAALVDPEHYLRRVATVIDFDRFRAVLAAAYNASLGRPALEPLLLLKLEFLQYQYNLSDREVIEHSRVNMAYRFFLNLSLKSPLPHHTLFTYFRKRLGVETHRRIFEDLIGQARERGLVKDRLRLKDATHVLANIAIPSTIALVSQTRQQLLDAARLFEPQRVTHEEAEAQRLHEATRDLSGAERLLQRVNHLRGLVAWADTLLEQVEQAAAGAEKHRQALRAALALAHQVLDDRAEPQAPDQVVSAHDPDARTGKHHVWYTGYLLDVSMDADSELVTAVNVLPANGDEAADATVLIEQEEQAHGNDVEALSIDGAGFRGNLLREWTDGRLHLDVIVPPSAEPTPTVFPPEAFTLAATGEALTCPAGQTTRVRVRNRHDTGWKYRFTSRQCAGCPLRAQCLQEPEQRCGRTVGKNDYEAEYRAAREKAKTPAYQEVRRQHPRIERKLGELVRWHEGRRARYRGQPKVLVQALLTTLVVNVKRLVKLVSGLGAPAAGTVRADLAGVT